MKKAIIEKRDRLALGVIIAVGFFVLIYFFSFIIQAFPMEQKDFNCEYVYDIKITKTAEFYVGSFEYKEPDGRGGTVLLGSRKSADAIMETIFNNYCK